jgi:hypothetical protein
MEAVMAEATENPKIVLELQDAGKMLVKIEWPGVESMAMVRAMLSEATHAVDKYIADLEAAEFGAKMNAAAAAHRAMQRGPLIRQ